MRSDVLVCLFLIAATFAVYCQVSSFDFVSFDDPNYVSENPNVQDGLSVKSITWSFAFNRYDGHWHPLTWLSLMLGCQLYGIDPGWHHLTNLLIHITNALLLFLVLRRMTGDLWQSAFVAGLFSLHPLHVESVAWVTERKDVLSTFFLMLTIWSYARYAERPGVNRYLLVLLLFVLGLMSKPMLVTLPFILLLLDYWPLGRFQFGQSCNARNLQQRPSALSLVWEKMPFFILTAASCVVTFRGMQIDGIVTSLDVLPLGARISNALVSYASYIEKMIWPFHLAVFYPHPGKLPAWQVAGACFLLLFTSLLVFRCVRQRPWFAVGWLWYIGTLVPVIGLVQIATYAMADRYTYVPLIGIFIMVAWGVSELAAVWRYRKTWLGATAAALISTLMVITWLQVHYWANSTMLFEHAIDATDNNYWAHTSLGDVLAGQGRTEDAIRHYTEALRINPIYAKARNNLGLALAGQGRTEDAIRHYTEVLRIDPQYVKARNNIGLALAEQGRTAEAISHYLEALKIKPDSAQVHNNLGLVLAGQGKRSEAVTHYREALRLNPDIAEAHNNLGVSLFHMGKINEAIVHFREALRIKPRYAKAHTSLGNALLSQGKNAEAITHYREALLLKPGNVDDHNNLGVALFREGKVAEAVSHFREALRINPDSGEARYNLKKISAAQGKIQGQKYP